MTKYDVFLRHTNEDRELAETVLSFLRMEYTDLDFWADFESSRPVPERPREILAAANDTAVFLLLGTTTAFQKGAPYPETSIAAQKHLLEKMPLVILAFHQPSMPNALRNFQYVDFSDLETGKKDLAGFLKTEFRVAGDRPWSIRRDIVEFPDGKTVKIGKPGCFDVLSAMARSDLRYRVAKSMSRQELATLWYELFESRMDSEIPNLPLQNAVMELLLRARRESVFPRCLQALCRNHPYLGKLHFKL